MNDISHGAWKCFTEHIAQDARPSSFSSNTGQHAMDSIAGHDVRTPPKHAVMDDFCFGSISPLVDVLWTKGPCVHLTRGGCPCAGRMCTIVSAPIECSISLGVRNLCSG
jgi:hypothetical protein